jgi:aarF domain-containing kinase
MRGARPLVALSSGVLAGSALVGSPDQNSPLKRYFRTIESCVKISFDYKSSTDPLPEIHIRSANNLLKLFRENGGVFVKVGQAIASLMYVFPPEYCIVMQALQDQCRITPMDQIELLFKTDLNKSINDLFVDFDQIPLGSASLSQVHKATLRKTETHPEKVVAVKIQHPELLKQAPADIETCKILVKVFSYIFPEFQFEWLSKEMQISLPQELDFINESVNAKTIADHLKNLKNVHIPEVYISSKRILIMECN